MASDEEMIKLTKLEFKTINDLSKRMTYECFMKCVPKVKDSDLHVGELSCIDRCAPKYLEVHELVQKEFQAINAQAQPQPAE